MTLEKLFTKEGAEREGLKRHMSPKFLVALLNHALEVAQGEIAGLAEAKEISDTWKIGQFRPNGFEKFPRDCREAFEGWLKENIDTVQAVMPQQPLPGEIREQKTGDRPAEHLQ